MSTPATLVTVVSHALTELGLLGTTARGAPPVAPTSAGEALLLIESGVLVNLQHLLCADALDDLFKQAARRLGHDCALTLTFHPDQRGPILLAIAQAPRWALPAGEVTP